MLIKVSPIRDDTPLEFSKAGDALTINGHSYDFSSLPDGATYPNVPCEWIVGPVERKGGRIHLTILSPHGANPSQSVAFPSSIFVPPDGVVALPTDKESDDVDT